SSDCSMASILGFSFQCASCMTLATSTVSVFTNCWSIFCPESPNTSDNTDPNLILASSKTFCNENTGVKPSFVSSRRILRLVIGDKAKRLYVVCELRSRRRVSVPHRVSADSRRRRYISTSHDQPRQSLFGSLVGT